MINAVREPVTQHNDGHVFLDKPVKRSIVAVPPSLVVDDLIAVCIAQHPPAQPIIFNTRLFKRAGAVSQFYGFVVKQDIFVK